MLDFASKQLCPLSNNCMSGCSNARRWRKKKRNRVTKNTSGPIVRTRPNELKRIVQRYAHFAENSCIATVVGVHCLNYLWSKNNPIIEPHVTYSHLLSKRRPSCMTKSITWHLILLPPLQWCDTFCNSATTGVDTLEAALLPVLPL